MASVAVQSIPHDLAQRVVEAAMADIPYNINIIDRSGLIIASGDPARLGHVHTSAVRALETRRPVEVDHDDEDQRIGINLPLAVDGEFIGVVGITGPLAEVRPMARLVRTAVSLLVSQNRAFAQQRLEALGAALATEARAYPPGVVELALSQGVDVSVPHCVILVEGDATTLPALQPRAFPLPGGKLLLEPSRVESALATWLRAAPEARFYVSEPHALAVDGVADVEALSAIHAALAMPGQVFRAADLKHLAMLRDLDPSVDFGALDEHPDLVHTLQAFIVENMSMSDTAAVLHVHRNTLLYRLNRIRDLTDHDPRQVLDLVALIGYILHRVSPPL